MESVCVQYLRTCWFVSEISLVRFPILDQLVRKYRTHTLSMKYSIFSILFQNVYFSFGLSLNLLPLSPYVEQVTLELSRVYRSRSIFLDFWQRAISRTLGSNYTNRKYGKRDVMGCEDTDT